MVFNNCNVEAWVKTFLGHTEENEQTMGDNAEQIIEIPVEKKSRWKTVAETSGKEAISQPVDPVKEDDSEDVDGEEMDENEDEEDGNVDGEPMEEDDLDGEPMEEPPSPSPPPCVPSPKLVEPQREEDEKEAPRPAKRQRMRAVDMFTED